VALLADTAARKNITIRHGIPAEAKVWADEDQVAAIFRNLLSNALKFTPSGGAVDLCAEKENGSWRVMISDTGVGMSEEKVRHLFEPNSVTSTLGTENERGLGLGLQICQEFVQSNGGVLSIKSEEGRGSSFQFTLPLPSDAS
jgi:signal transduction histidine kinase